MDFQNFLDLRHSLKQDILKNNHCGAVCSSTVILCNTKCWHSLLSVYNPKTKGMKNLLSTLDDSVIANNKTYYLSTRKYPDVYFPLGHQYIKNITFNPFTCIDYQLGNVKLVKEMLLASNEETVLFRYSLEESDGPVKLQIRPIVAFRDAMQLIRMDRGILTGNTPVHNGIGYRPRKEEDTMLFMQTSKPCEFVTAPDWNYNIEYTQDRLAGRPYQEDLFMPGFFEVEIAPGSEIYFSASTKAQNPDTLVDFFKSETGTRTKRKSYDDYLQFSARQMFRDVNNECQVLERIPARDYFSCHLLGALPGLTLPDGNRDLFLKTAQSYTTKLRNCAFGSIEKRNYDPESPFWFVWAVQQYAYHIGNPKEIYQQFGSYIMGIIKHGMEGHIPGLFTSVNGLIRMERNGLDRYYIDVNALWYNSLMYCAELLLMNREDEFASEISAYAKKLKLAFSTRFVDRRISHLADSINDDDDKDLVCRPDQLLAVALPYSVAPEEKVKDVLKALEEKLLTPLGLRTCPTDYKKYHVDGEGDIYPRYLGFMAELYIKACGGKDGLKKAEEIYRTYDSERIEVDSPNFYECHDAEPPYEGKGSPLFAGSIAAIYRIKLLIDQY